MIGGFLSSAGAYNLQTQSRLLCIPPCGFQGKISGMELPCSSGFDDNFAADTSLFQSANGAFFLDTINYPKWHTNFSTNSTTATRDRFNMDISRIAPTANDNAPYTSSSIKWRRTN